MKIKRALISISDKRNIEDFVRGLDEMGVEIISTGGTANLIKGFGIKVRGISDFTGFPEILNGRVKTLHPKVHGGLLALRDNQDHMKTVKDHGIELIDMVVVNLYPFGEVIKKPGISFEEAIENIDIGGPSMIRSASKNFRSVAVVSNPSRYGDILKELKTHDCSLSEATLLSLATEAFALTSWYDSMIYNYLKSKSLEPLSDKSDFPENFSINFKKIQDLRYGENPHQRAVFYKDSAICEPGISNFIQLHGKELSFNNIIDLNAAIEVVKEFEKPAACIIKHTNPCGAAVAATLKKAYKDALDSDRLSAFGSIVGLNKKVDQDTAKAIISADFVECVVAPGYEPKALEILKVKKNLRIIEIPGFNAKKDLNDLDFKKVVGGLLIQDRDLKDFNSAALKVVTKKKPSGAELDSLMFAWKIVKHVKSNAIVLCKGTKTVGVGAGQTSRVDSVNIAVSKAGKRAKGSVLASDAFFPKEDGILSAAKHGVKAIIQPGGSIRDEAVIKTADKKKISMVFTGIRHFKH